MAVADPKYEYELFSKKEEWSVMRVNHKTFSVIAFIMTLFFSLGACFTAAASGGWQGTLRPTQAAIDIQERYQVNLPFYQAIPVARGQLSPVAVGDPETSLLHESGQRLPAVARPIVYWPDGSVRWVAVEGIWPENISFGQARGELVSSAADAPGEKSSIPQTARVHGLSVVDNQVRLVDAHGRAIATLFPQASYIEITRKKDILPDTIPDDERQYAWAEPLKALNPSGSPQTLNLRIREHIVEEDNELFTLHRLRGDGGGRAPGSGLEWQLRVRIYKGTAIVRLQMTWGLQWDTEKYALTQAEWVAEFSTPFNKAQVAGVDSALDLSLGAVRQFSDPTGRGFTTHQGSRVAEAEWPDALRDVAVLKHQGGSGESFVGVGSPAFSRLGPNHISFEQDRIVFASWSDELGYGLDLRLTAEVDEFGMSSSDVTTSGVGVSRTLEASLVWGQQWDEVEALAAYEAQRDSIWLPTQADLVATNSLGPWAAHTFETNADYFEDLNIMLHFILASRDHWRWNGWANFGDIRTNFSRGSNPDRGLHPDRWSLHGRYGWRKGAAEPYLGMWLSGLALEERDVLMAAFDYALHVSDVDVIHGSFFGPRTPEVGGMHRRNKDHWSGSAQMQYTPSTGLYLTYWLTGHERIADTLEEVREYARGQGPSSSAYAGLAWIHRYMETQDPQDLTLARSLLDQSALPWERRGLTPTNPSDSWGNPDPNAKLTGLAALYQNNFRLPTNGIPTLIEFYEATGDREYLDAIFTTLKVHGIPSGVNAGLGDYYGLAYLLLNGYSEEAIGVDTVEAAREQVAQLISRASQSPLRSRDEWTYENLMRAASKGSSVETTTVGWRATYAPVVMRAFGRPPVELRPISPRDGARVAGVVPLSLELVNSPEGVILERVIIEVGGQVIYDGPHLPDSGELSIDTLALDDGRQRWSVTTVLQDLGAHRHSFSLNVANHWSLIQNMTPPVTQGWFGTIDYLRTERRSAGWTYETGKSQEFFGDPERLVRATEETEYLIWKTPRLKTAKVTAFVRSESAVEAGLELAVSQTGQDWRIIPYEVEFNGPNVGGWYRADLTADVEGEVEYDYFRLRLLENIAKEIIQVGEVSMIGYESSNEHE